MSLVSAVNTVNGQRLYAEFAVRDHKGRVIVDTYATKAELSGAVSGISGNMSGVSAVLENEIRTLSAKTYELVSAESERASAAEIYLSGGIDYVSGTISGFNDKIDSISAAMEYSAARLSQEIAEEAERAVSAENCLDDKIDALSDIVADDITSISGRVDELSGYTRDSIDMLSAAIGTERERAETVEEELADTIRANDDYLSAGIDYLSAAIDAETERAVSAEGSISAALGLSASVLQGEIDVLDEKIGEGFDYVMDALETASGALSGAIDEAVEGLTDYVDDVAGTVSSNIENELQSVSAILSGAIDYETERAQAEEARLDEKIDLLTSATSGDFTELIRKIDTVSGNLDTLSGNEVTAWSVVPDDIHYPSEKLVKDSLDAKADKVVPTSAGNLAGLDINGNLTDSGIPGSNVLQSAIMVLNDSGGGGGIHDLVNPSDSTQVYIEEMTNQQIDDIINALA